METGLNLFVLMKAVYATYLEEKLKFTSYTQAVKI